MRLLLGGLIAIFTLLSCSKAEKSRTANGETIELTVEKLTERQDMLDWVDSMSVIPLNATCEDALFKQINV